MWGMGMILYSSQEAKSLLNIEALGTGTTQRTSTFLDSFSNLSMTPCMAIGPWPHGNSRPPPRRILRCILSSGPEQPAASRLSPMLTRKHDATDDSAIRMTLIPFSAFQSSTLAYLGSQDTPRWSQFGNFLIMRGSCHPTITEPCSPLFEVYLRD